MAKTFPEILLTHWHVVEQCLSVDPADGLGTLSFVV
jgi:hypothetical protein